MESESILYAGQVVVHTTDDDDGDDDGDNQDDGGNHDCDNYGESGKKVPWDL